MGRRVTSIAEYIEAAPKAGQPHLRKLHALLKKVAPKAEEAIKWNQPFFIEPRFLFSFCALKKHLNFIAARTSFANEKLGDYKTTPMGILQVPYDKPLPEALIRKVAKAQVQAVRKRKDASFW